jgi:hypothetical protein
MEHFCVNVNYVYLGRYNFFGQVERIISEKRMSSARYKFLHFSSRFLIFHAIDLPFIPQDFHGLLVALKQDILNN